MSVIGFLGLGIMGGPMAANLVKAGHDVRGFDLSEASLKTFSDAGGTAVASAAEAASGASAQGTFTAPAAGTYQVVCVIPGHFDSGMEGELTVEG